MLSGSLHLLHFGCISVAWQAIFAQGSRKRSWFYLSLPHHSTINAGIILSGFDVDLYA